LPKIEILNPHIEKASRSSLSPGQQEHANSQKGGQHTHAGRLLCRLVLGIIFEEIVIKMSLLLGALCSYAQARDSNDLGRSLCNGTRCL
jgi:hypothetical protein